MEAFYSSMGLSITAETRIKYGKQDNINNVWKKIISIENSDKRNQKIDQIISLMEANKEANGFICRDDIVEINKIGNSFKIDDNELYYMFFQILKVLKDTNPKEIDERILFHAIKHTIKNYFGSFTGNRKKRMKLTSLEIVDDAIQIPSISAQKGKNCSLCVERASVSHNLWLLTGAKSHYVNSLDCNFGENLSEYSNDGHAFCVVEIDGIYKLFDPTMQIYQRLSINPIEKMLNGESFEITTKAKETFTYANASINKKR